MRFNLSTLNKLCFEFFYWYICWYLNIWLKIEYHFYKNFTFFILSHVLFFVNCDFYDFVVMKSNQSFFLFQVFYMHISFSIKLLFTLFKLYCIINFRKIVYPHTVSYHTRTHTMYLDFKGPYTTIQLRTHLRNQPSDFIYLFHYGTMYKIKDLKPL